jgi:GNAT superfamily N-acetyltransferase
VGVAYRLQCNDLTKCLPSLREIPVNIPSNLKVRNLVFEDLPSLLKLQEEAYIQELLETERAFQRKIEVFPDGCLCAEKEGQIHAYVMSHPWRGGEEVEIDARDLVIPDPPDCYYIHDLVVDQSCRGEGVAGLLVKRVFEVAGRNGLSRIVLVAVQNSEQFWGHYGFQPVRKLSYGRNVPATYMEYLPEVMAGKK